MDAIDAAYPSRTALAALAEEEESCRKAMVSILWESPIELLAARNAQATVRK